MSAYEGVEAAANSLSFAFTPSPLSFPDAPTLQLVVLTLDR